MSIRGGASARRPVGTRRTVPPTNAGDAPGAENAGNQDDGEDKEDDAAVVLREAGEGVELGMHARVPRGRGVAGGRTTGETQGGFQP